MRDFLLAHFTVFELATKAPEKINELFAKIRNWPIYEGYIRYVYILGRKEKCAQVIEGCEAFDDFDQHYLNNLGLLSDEIQNEGDVLRIRAMLGSLSRVNDLHHLAWTLFRKRESAAPLNVQLLVDHLSELDDVALENFAMAMFMSENGYIDKRWQDRVSHLLKSLIELNGDLQLGLGAPVLAVALYVAPFGRWDEREATKNLFSNRAHEQTFNDAINLCKKANSNVVQRCIAEIEGEQATT